MWASELDDDDLTAAIEAARWVPADTADHVAQHDLAALLLESYDRHGDAAVLDEAIALLSRAVQAAAVDPVTGTDHRIGLGKALEDRAWATGSVTDADAAVALARSVLADGAQHLVERLIARSNLANALLTRYEITGGPDQVIEAVAHARAVADTFPESDHRRASMFANLGDALQTAYRSSGDISELNDAISAGRTGVRLARAGDPGLPGYLLNLANGLLTWSEAQGDAGVTEEAVTVARRAVAACRPDGAKRSLTLACLGNCLRCRHELTGELAVLDEAIEADRAALAATSPATPGRAQRLTNLAISLTLRHEAEPDLAVLDEALDCARAGAATVGEDDPDRYQNLLTLARTEYVKFQTTEDRDALDRSIEAERQACQLLDADYPGRPIALANLAASLIARGRPPGGSGGELDSAELDPADFHAAAGLLTEAVALTPADSPDSALYLYNLGEARASLARSGAGAAADAVAAFRACAEVEVAPPMLRAEAATEWGRLCAAEGDWTGAAEAFGLTVELAPLISPQHLERDDQERRHAAACVLAGREDDPSAGLRALTLLEQGRALLVGYLLGGSADLTKLREAAPDLAAKFVRLRDEIDAADAGKPSAADTPDGGMPQRFDPVLRRRDLLRDRAAVVRQIRSIDGLADFLRAPDRDQLLTAGSAGPFILINISRYRCDAIAICEGSVEVVPLPGVTLAGVTEVTAKYLRMFGQLRRPGQVGSAQPRDTLREVSGWLWDCIARPVLTGLGLPRRDGEVPRVWWCPTGSLALLPLHAAHRYDKAREADVGVADWVVSSYAASARTLLSLRGRARVPDAGTGQLVVALDRTPGLSDLPQVVREVEVVGGAAGQAPLVLRNEAATRDAVRAGLASHPWFHFAGHSYQDLLHPGRARLCLSDGGLDALTIAAERLAGGELAYLSCCEGAVPGTKVPDEPLHLALAFQIAGYRHVIATLWSIDDRVAAEVARRIYLRLRSGANLMADVAARALREVVLELRDLYPDDVWAAYLHAGI